MKFLNVLTVFLLLGPSMGLAAKSEKNVLREPASGAKEMEGGEIISIIYASCPEKLDEAMKGANSVGKIFQNEKIRGDITTRVWVLTTVNQLPAPSFTSSPVATLSIEWTSQPETGPMAPDRGTRWEISCKVIR